ncbi:MAG TPA: helicase C-terminal domain-containing protein [Phycisphaerales bacterium]|nr:helicase C-terminal domain-containing protein [Phycisphaerales bacterium]
MAFASAAILGHDGPIARALGPDYEPREQQLRMADAVAAAMEQKAKLLVEAGTGVGKSFAYLVPAIERILSRGETVVVATNTIALQEQLVERDIPLLKATLETDGVEARPGEAPPRQDAGPGRAPPRWSGDLRACLVKGRGNYVSIRRLELASKRQDKLFADAAARRSLHVIEEWAYETTDGTLSTMPPVERMGVWDKVQSDSANCMGRKCPTYEKCFYQAARRRMERSNLLVCNHALFFSDLALRMRGVGFLPSYDHVILDEAHGVEDVAAEHFGLSLSEGRVNHLLSTLFQARTQRGYLANLLNLHADGGAVERAIDLVRRAELAARDFFERVLVLHDSPGVQNGRVREARAVPNALTPAMNDLAMRLRSLREDVKDEQDRFELASYVERAASIADVAEAWVEQSAEQYVYWIEAQRPGDDGSDGGAYRGLRVSVAASPIDVAPLLDKHLFSKEHSTILTSATLATRTIREGEATERAETAFAHAITRLGCEGARTLQLGSPFEYARQVEVYVDRTMPAPNAGNGGRSGWGRGARGGAPQAARETESYEQALAKRILHHVRETEGGAFVLFTSFATLNRVADLLRTDFANADYPLLAQGRDGSRSELLRRFRDTERSVLFGAASFWQGVDVRGRTLRNVIITRLPFEPPDRPLTEARLERIRDRGGDPFKEDSLPRAVIRFKQGFGRLIRSATDTGRVVVLDPRVLSTGYGRTFLAALPEGVRTNVIHGGAEGVSEL